ncbi:MAG: hypothetical protein J5527_11045 [Treponema sp.]|nr:hypothetical protein [Treponema sp.]
MKKALIHSHSSLRFLRALFLGSFICFSGTAFAQEALGPEEFKLEKFHGWKKAETEHFQFFYEDAMRETAEDYALIADDAWNKIAKIYSPPQDKTNVYIVGRTNTVNAYTFFSPPYIEMFDTPFLDSVFTFRTDWKKLFFTHELIHIANVNFEDRNKILPKVMGNYAYSFDLLGVNGWALEGLTTVLETELTEGGRGRSPYWELEYKAPTLDNAFISYTNIGQEEEPPYGQIYVMGYLIMRSIADRWGLDALADIERNRKLLGSWEDSVKLVTGQYAQDIYRDVRIALMKKYADERKIPEGQIISSRNNKTFYFKPAIIFDDGTLITLRSAPGQRGAVVKLDPSARSGSNYLSDTKPEEDLNTVFKETILTEYGFSGEDSVTADENMTIYYSSFEQSMDQRFGTSVELPIFKWTKDDGAKQLTKHGSFDQPSVSRDGKVLVAVNLKGRNTRLVKIDTETGAVYSLLEDKNLSFAQPAVNDDGTKIAFLVLDGHRARVAVMDTAAPDKYTIVANDDEKIFDPTYPVWQKDGKLTFCCNYRGRLEIFEVDVDGKDEAEGKSTLTPVPVVADPIGATWAYKNEKGIFYASHASSGDVIKIKPASEWGVVPDFDGPSPAGEIIHFGQLENDYPDFVPYVIASEVEVPEKTKEEKKAERKEKLEKEKEEKLNILKKDKDKTDGEAADGEDSDEKKEPKPVEGKTVKHRPEESKKKAEEANTTITTLQNEKRTLLPYSPLLYTPIFGVVTDVTKDETEFGFGGMFLATAPYVYSSNSMLLAYANYYPTIKNFAGSFAWINFFGNTEVDILASRFFKTPNVAVADGPNEFKVFNTANIGFTQPFYHKYFGREKELDISFISSLTGTIVNTCNHLPSMNDDFVNAYTLAGNFGIDYFYSKDKDKGQHTDINFTALGLSCYDFTAEKLLWGVQGELFYKDYLKTISYNLGLSARYTPAQINVDSFLSLLGSSTTVDDPTYPVKAVPHVGIIMPNLLGLGLDFEAYGEALLFFGKENQSGLDKALLYGFELALGTGRLKLAIGFCFDAEVDDNVKLINNDNNFYFNIKYNWIRN